MKAHEIGKAMMKRERLREERTRCTCIWESVQTSAAGTVEYLDYKDPACAIHGRLLPEEVEQKLHPQDSNLPRSE